MPVPSNTPLAARSPWRIGPTSLGVRGTSTSMSSSLRRRAKPCLNIYRMGLPTTKRALKPSNGMDRSACGGRTPLLTSLLEPSDSRRRRPPPPPGPIRRNHDPSSWAARALILQGQVRSDSRLGGHRGNAVGEVVRPGSACDPRPRARRRRRSASQSPRRCRHPSERVLGLRAGLGALSCRAAALRRVRLA